MLFLDYLIVIALSALFVPHYFGLALGIDAITRQPGDVIAAASSSPRSRPGACCGGRASTRFGIVVPVLDLVTQVLLVVFGFALLFSGSALTRGLSLGTHPTWHQIAFALPLAMLAYTGLETVANYAEEVRSPGATCRAASSARSALVVVIYVLIALVGLSAYPGAARDDRARDRLAARAADGHRRRAPGGTCRTGSPQRCASTSA